MSDYVESYVRESTKIKVRNVNDVEIGIDVVGTWNEEDTKASVLVPIAEAQMLASAIKHNANVYFNDLGLGLQIPSGSHESACLTVDYVPVYIPKPWLHDFKDMIENAIGTKVW